MSQDIVLEVDFLFHSFLLGILITVLYDLLRILRRVIPHSFFAVSFEDFAYWILCFCLIFKMLYRENNGVLRWFAIAGAMTGMFLYRKTIGFFLVKYVSLWIKKILHVVGKILIFILKPLFVAVKGVKIVRRKSAKRLKWGLRIVKKKLTDVKKMLKIILCKQ